MSRIQVGSIIRRESLEGWDWGTFRVTAVHEVGDHANLAIEWAGNPKSASVDRYERIITGVGPDGISRTIANAPVRIVVLQSPEPVEGATLDLFAP